MNYPFRVLMVNRGNVLYMRIVYQDESVIPNRGSSDQPYFQVGKIRVDSVCTPQWYDEDGNIILFLRGNHETKHHDVSRISSDQRTKEAIQTINQHFKQYAN